MTGVRIWPMTHVVFPRITSRGTATLRIMWLGCRRYIFGDLLKTKTVEVFIRFSSFRGTRDFSLRAHEKPGLEQDLGGANIRKKVYPGMLPFDHFLIFQLSQRLCLGGLISSEALENHPKIEWCKGNCLKSIWSQKHDPKGLDPKTPKPKGVRP